MSDTWVADLHIIFTYHVYSMIADMKIPGLTLVRPKFSNRGILTLSIFVIELQFWIPYCTRTLIGGSNWN